VSCSSPLQASDPRHYICDLSALSDLHIAHSVSETDPQQSPFLALWLVLNLLALLCVNAVVSRPYVVTGSTQDSNTFRFRLMGIAGFLRIKSSFPNAATKYNSDYVMIRAISVKPSENKKFKLYKRSYMVAKILDKNWYVISYNSILSLDCLKPWVRPVVFLDPN